MSCNAMKKDSTTLASYSDILSFVVTITMQTVAKPFISRGLFPQNEAFSQTYLGKSPLCSVCHPPLVLNPLPLKHWQIPT